MKKEIIMSAANQSHRTVSVMNVTKAFGFRQFSPLSVAEASRFGLISPAFVRRIVFIFLAGCAALLHMSLSVAEASSFGCSIPMNIGTLGCVFAVDTALDAQKQLIIEYLRTDQSSKALAALSEVLLFRTSIMERRDVMT